MSPVRWLVLGRNRFGFVLARYWVRSEQGLWRAKAEMSQDWMIVQVDVIELSQEQEAQAS